VTRDPFEILGLPLEFSLSDARIEGAYLARVARVHPDVAGDEESGEASAWLNEARRVLKDPEGRANALLSALGGPAKEADKSLPDGFLVQVMEVREELEGAMESGDAARVGQARAWAGARRAEYVAAVSALFSRANGSMEVLREIRRELNAWRYIERLIEQLEPGYDPGRADFR
jgi:molecular chaperone HscB